MNIPNQCADCGKEFSSPLRFNKHNREYHQKNESNCNICERKFHTAYILKKHIGNVHTIEKCNVCDTGVAKGVLARHMKTHLESKFECEKCENVYTRKDNLQKHQLNCGGDIVKCLKKNTAVVIFSCESCSKTFTQKRYLTQHKRTHRIDMGMFDCKLCDKIYTSNQKLGKHIEKHHPNPRRVENAAIGFLVLESSPPRNHMAKKPERIYSCKQCPYVSGQKANLKRHIDTHTSNKVKTGRPKKSPGKWSSVTKRLYAKKSKQEF